MMGSVIIVFPWTVLRAPAKNTSIFFTFLWGVEEKSGHTDHLELLEKITEISHGVSISQSGEWTGTSVVSPLGFLKGGKGVGVGGRGRKEMGRKALKHIA